MMMFVCCGMFCCISVYWLLLVAMWYTCVRITLACFVLEMCTLNVCRRCVFCINSRIISRSVVGILLRSDTRVKANCDRLWKNENGKSVMIMIVCCGMLCCSNVYWLLLVALCYTCVRNTLPFFSIEMCTLNVSRRCVFLDLIPNYFKECGGNSENHIYFCFFYFLSVDVASNRFWAYHILSFWGRARQVYSVVHRFFLRLQVIQWRGGGAILGDHMSNQRPDPRGGLGNLKR